MVSPNRYMVFQANIQVIKPVTPQKRKTLRVRVLCSFFFDELLAIRNIISQQSSRKGGNHLNRNRLGSKLLTEWGERDIGAIG